MFHRAFMPNGDEPAVLGREMRAETRAFAIQSGLKPSHIGFTCSLQPKSAHLVGQNSKLGQGTILLEAWKIREGEVAAKLLIAFDALVIGNEIAAAIEDQPVTIDLEPARMVGGMTMQKVASPGIDQRMGERALLLVDAVAPIRAPMNGRDHDIAWPAERNNAPGNLACGRKR